MSAGERRRMRRVFLLLLGLVLLVALIEDPSAYEPDSRPGRPYVDWRSGQLVEPAAP